MKQKVKIKSKFWNQYRELIVDKVLPYQWEVMNDKDIEMTHEPGGNEEHLSHSHAIQNLEIVAGIKVGDHNGYPFQDTDVYKWLEAAAYSLSYHDDPKMVELTEKLIDLIASAQEDDGYFVTYFQIKAENRKFARLKQSHELYTMGHFIEAAVAYYQVTQNEKVLNIAINMADCIDANFGVGKIEGTDGHPEIELALARLYEVTGEARYINLAKYFIDIRGTNNFFDEQIQTDGIDRDVIDGMKNFPLSYYQAQDSIMNQKTAEGHAVRMVYLCAGMAKVANHLNDEKLKSACKVFWENIVNKKMYITGAIGSTNIGESFTGDYDLPNDTMYGETCASVAMAFFAKEMLGLEADGKYADVLEKELFNGIISGMSLDGTHFFYVNPLQANDYVTRTNPSRSHAITSRAEWFGCACCPSNVARLIASIDRYIYSESEEVILSHQFISNEAVLKKGLVVNQITDFPWDNKVKYEVRNQSGDLCKFGIRIPSWSKSTKIRVDGIQIQPIDEKGFVYFNIDGEKTTIELELDMSIKRYKSNNNVAYNIGKVAVQRGPLVYCMERVDHQTDVWKYMLPKNSEFSYEYKENKLMGIGEIKVPAKVLLDDSHELYSEYEQERYETAVITMVPYYSWANRGEGQMQVWIDTID